VSARELGPVWQEYAGDAWVSTCFRESSAVLCPLPYFETMAFRLDGTGGFLWQSAAVSEREARRQHELAVRWFSSRAALGGASPVTETNQ
jgi:hypothetical protein